MRIECVPLPAVPAAEYDALAGDSFFASRGFLALWSAQGGRAVAWTCVEAGRLVAVLPGVEYGHGPCTRFASLPDGCYGGLLVRPERAAQRVAIADAVLRAVARRHYAKAFLYDFHRTLPGHPGFDFAACTARLVAIGPGWSPPDRKLQAQIRKAAREGVAIEALDWGRHHAGFLRLAAGTARVHGVSPRYGPAFYRALAGLAGRDPRVVWLWCEHRGEPVASQVYFVERGMLQAWQSYLDRSFSFLKAGQAMRAAACAAAIERGVRTLNLGSTPPGAIGLARFKARWGGENVSYASYLRREGLGVLAALGREVRPARAGVPVPARAPLAGARS